MYRTMKTLLLEPQRRRITVDQYLAEIGETEERYELVDGEVWQMAGGSIEHGVVGAQIFGTLFGKLAGSGCRALGSDVGVRLDELNFRYPDVAIYCDPRDFARPLGQRRLLQHPKVIFEVLSPSTRVYDKGVKVAGYKALPSVAAIVLVDLGTRTIEVHERTGPAAWTQREVAAGDDLVLADPAVTLTAAEIFGDA